MQSSWSMQTPISVTFHGLPRSEAAEAAIERSLTRLEHLQPHLVHAHAWVDRVHHHGRDQRFRVRLAIGLPGTEITVSHESGHSDIYVAITEAFAAAHRQLQDHLRIQRGDIKARAS